MDSVRQALAAAIAAADHALDAAARWLASQPVFEGLWTLELAPQEAAIRLLAAIVCGGVLGIDREWRGRPAGLRTHMLVALASAAFTITAFEIYAELKGEIEAAALDPLRLLEAITAGVAFLAAGAIIRNRDQVKGLTTGAGLWLSGALGVSCGRGMLGLAALTLSLAFVVLTILGVIERSVNRRIGADAKKREYAGEAESEEG